MDFLVSSLAEHYPPGKFLKLCTAVKYSVKYPHRLSRPAWTRRRRARPRGRWGRGWTGTATSAASVDRSSSKKHFYKNTDLTWNIEGPRRSSSAISSPNTDIMTIGECHDKNTKQNKIHLHRKTKNIIFMLISCLPYINLKGSPESKTLAAYISTNLSYLDSRSRFLCYSLICSLIRKIFWYF